MTKALGQGYHILLGRWVMEDVDRCEKRDMDSIPHEGSNLSPPLKTKNISVHLEKFVSKEKSRVFSVPGKQSVVVFSESNEY